MRRAAFLIEHKGKKGQRHMGKMAAADRTTETSKLENAGFTVEGPSSPRTYCSPTRPASTQSSSSIQTHGRLPHAHRLCQQRHQSMCRIEGVKTRTRRTDYTQHAQGNRYGHISASVKHSPRHRPHLRRSCKAHACKVVARWAHHHVFWMQCSKAGEVSRSKQ